MGWIKITFATLLGFFVITSSWAQQFELDSYNYDSDSSESGAMYGADTTLFRLAVVDYTEIYAQAFNYYSLPVTLYRRGLYYSVAQSVISPRISHHYTLEQPLPQSSISVSAGGEDNLVALRASHSQMLQSRWMLSSSLFSATGRSAFVQGLFTNSFTPRIALSRRWDNDHFLVAEGSLYYSQKGLQSGSTQEAFDLVNSSYYNPSWGFYGSQVRNSRVRRTLSPTLKLHYQRPLSEKTILDVEGSASYNRKANSSLAWYNVSSPMPDYYRYMPSYLPEGEVRDIVTQYWQNADSHCTQINWEDLVTRNAMASDGSAYYTLEDRVVRNLKSDLAAHFTSRPTTALSLSYGVEAKAEQSRNFKVMRDLLGADHLADYDVFIGDSYNKTMPLQNNLQDPDRQVAQGDRFGYDYAILHTEFLAHLAIEYHCSNLDIDLAAVVGGENYFRHGYYERERFAGAASLGDSSQISNSPYTFSAKLGSNIGARSYLSLSLLSSQLSPLTSTLFLDAESANIVNSSCSGERINSASLLLSVNEPLWHLSCELYALRSTNGSSLYKAYDDLLSQMCVASISQIAYASLGAEITARLYMFRNLSLSATLAAGRYYYCADPLVELFEYSTLDSISSAVSSQLSGINLGNAPQIVATASASYFGLGGYIFGLNASYAARRYSSPSILRRSDRVLSQAFLSQESTTAAMAQEQLGDIFDIELSASRSFYLASDHRLSVRIKVNNLLGQNNRVTYSRESDRIMLQSTDDTFTGATLRDATLQYGAPRTFSVSLSYWL